MVGEVSREEQRKLLDAAIEEELRAIFEYDEMLEIFPEDSELIKKIMKDEANHAVEFRAIQIRKGFPETDLWQEVENTLGIIELQHGIKTGMPALEKLITS